MTTWGQLAASISGVVEPHPVPMYTLAGTSAASDQGFPADVGRGVDPDKLTWVPVDYPASFGGVMPAPSGSPDSYQESVAEGVKSIVSLINATPGKFALGGYSQGAEGVSRVLIELQHGSLQHRMQDFVGGFTFGNPCREQDHTFPGGTNPGGHGISSTRISHTPEMWWDFAHPGDMYANVPSGQVGDNITAVYNLVTELQFHNMLELAKDISEAFIAKGGLAEQLVELLTNPLNLVAAGESAAIAIGFVASNPPTLQHINYDADEPLGDGRSSVQIAIDHMNSLV